TVGQGEAVGVGLGGGGGGWRQEFAPPDDGAAAATVETLSVSGRCELEAACERLQGSLNLEDGPLLRLAYFDRGRLLIVVHHLAVDAVSWPVLLQDLFAAVEQSTRGLAPALPPKTTGFRDWAEHLHRLAASDEVRAEAGNWLAVVESHSGRLPRDFPDGRNDLADVESIDAELDEETTRR